MSNMVHVQRNAIEDLAHLVTNPNPLRSIPKCHILQFPDGSPAHLLGISTVSQLQAKPVGSVAVFGRKRGATQIDIEQARDVHFCVILHHRKRRVTLAKVFRDAAHVIIDSTPHSVEYTDLVTSY